MKNIVQILITFLCIVSSTAQVRFTGTNNLAVATGSAFLDASSNATNNASTSIGKGLVFPRVSLGTFTFGTATTGIGASFPGRYDGMIVYNTTVGGVAGAGTTDGTLSEGFWYYYNKSNTNAGGTWKKLGADFLGSTSVVLNGASFERAALTGDITAAVNSNATTISNDAVTSAKILDGTIVTADIADGNITMPKLANAGATTGQVLKWNGSVWAPATDSDTTYSAGSGVTINSGSIAVNDATTIAKGIVQLAGDLGGTASSPTVPGLALKAPIDSPDFTGTPTAPTATIGTVSNQLATTAFVNSRPIAIKTSNYTATASDETILCNTTAASFTLTLPNPSTSVGKIFNIRKVDETLNALNIVPNIKVSEATTVSSINFNTSIRVQSNGTNWYIVQ